MISKVKINPKIMVKELTKITVEAKTPPIIHIEDLMTVSELREGAFFILEDAQFSKMLKTEGRYQVLVKHDDIMFVKYFKDRGTFYSSFLRENAEW
jgi:hypothetical protein